jgi:hypothetical protein
MSTRTDQTTWHARNARNCAFAFLQGPLFVYKGKFTVFMMCRETFRQFTQFSSVWTSISNFTTKFPSYSSSCSSICFRNTIPRCGISAGKTFSFSGHENDIYLGRGSAGEFQQLDKSLSIISFQPHSGLRRKNRRNFHAAARSIHHGRLYPTS